MQTKRYHHIFDLKNCNEKINDRAEVRKFIEEVTKGVDMQILEGPIVAEGVQSNPGLSALAIIDFSHVSVHTFTDYNEALIDVFSCKEYDREKVLAICLKYFGNEKTEVRKKEVWWG